MVPTRRLLVVVALSVPLGCTFFESKVRVYVDNGGSADFEVSVDEATAVTVPAHGYAVLELKPGSHRFVVRRQGQALYDQSRTFPTSDKVTKYVLNPDMTNRYTTQVVNYHGSGWSAPTFDTGAGDALRATALLKPDPWVAGGFDEVLDETPPKSVRKKRGNLDPVRIRLCRIAPADHDRLAAAQAEYLKALQNKPDQLPSLDSDTEAALQRVLRACP